MPKNLNDWKARCQQAMDWLPEDDGAALRKFNEEFRKWLWETYGVYTTLPDEESPLYGFMISHKYIFRMLEQTTNERNLHPTSTSDL